MKTKTSITSLLESLYANGFLEGSSTNRMPTHSVFLYKGKNNFVAAPQSEACLAPTFTRWDDNLFDTFGVTYQGHGGKYTDEAREWLNTAMNPKGPFAGVLRNLHRNTPGEITNSRGFILKDLNDCNPGLIWTFLLVVRMIFEHPSTMARFIYLKDKVDPIMAMYLTLTIQPMDTANMDGVWVPKLHSHGEPLGENPRTGQCAQLFLNSVPMQHDRHGPQGSWACFDNGHTTHTSKTKQNLSDWIKLFEGERKAYGTKSAA